MLIILLKFIFILRDIIQLKLSNEQYDLEHSGAKPGG